MTNLLLIMTVIYLSCLFNHAVLWIEQSPWERRRLPRVKLLAQSCGRAARSRPVAPAPCGLNKLGFIRVSRKAEFLETSHFPSSASNLFLSLRATWSGGLRAPATASGRIEESSGQRHLQGSDPVPSSKVSQDLARQDPCPFSHLSLVPLVCKDR